MFKFKKEKRKRFVLKKEKVKKKKDNEAEVSSFISDDAGSSTNSSNSVVPSSDFNTWYGELLEPEFKIDEVSSLKEVRIFLLS